MADLTHITGQAPHLPGAVRAGDLIVTSGIVDPAIFQDVPPPSFRDQAQAALAQLLSFVTEAGGSAASVLRVEAYIGRAEDHNEWNEVYTAVWPVPGPARTTVVTSFAIPGIKIEMQAIAVRS
ncbi:RidA family protein [Streptomyces doebereineriae]|uniref:RidA family protein n=1 Tax=Streptomyces doebereineriae TaxID=3075528 RepID=A0ABU2VK75_9ACTN|nr:RidA family protein [Streptomyces sp. DSM 41640]MDT0485942.1 RidA family protein [Streptomyces sp. DSM 41640]